MNTTTIEAAAWAIADAKSLLVATGAGMGVDSGLPDFRGTQGFWRAYPPFAALGLKFEEVADPRWFRTDPQLAWGFYGHRANLYRDTTPHAGFAILRDWMRTRHGFVFTSNVDGHFQKSGFADEKIWEVHGSIRHRQCSLPCCPAIWECDEFVPIDEDFRALEPLPICPRCSQLSRPNILMFGDHEWLETRSEGQQARFYTWLEAIDLSNLAIIEIGAGTAIPTVRRLSERLQQRGATLIRINPREAQGPSGTISFENGALDTLQVLAQALEAQTG